MREKTCCFTGHRIIPSEIQPSIQIELEKIIRGLIREGISYFGVGGAIGFDMMAAEVILQLKNFYPHIRLILVIPCLQHTRNWSIKNLKEYEQIVRRADKVVYTSKTYSKGCMQLRNRHLVNHSCVCVAFCMRLNSGSAYTVDYAKKQGLKVIYVNR